MAYKNHSNLKRKAKKVQPFLYFDFSFLSFLLRVSQKNSLVLMLEPDLLQTLLHPINEED